MTWPKAALAVPTTDDEAASTHYVALHSQQAHKFPSAWWATVSREARLYTFLLVGVALTAGFYIGSTGPLDIAVTETAYEVDKVDWAALRSDLEAFVPQCQCAPILVRLSWHDAGTWNASDSTGGSHAEQRFPGGEADDPANAGLGVARGLLQPYKERYPAVGYADLWALAATVAIEASGGPPVPFRAGRVDGAEGAAVPHGRLPDGALGARHLRTVFYRMGFDDEDIVALSGAHTLGRCHADRSGFEGPWTSAPLSFDTEYYQLLLECEWTPAAAPTTGKPQMACAAEPSLMMLHTDVALVTDARFKPHVERFAKDQAAFFAAFAKAFARLQENGHANLQEV